LTEGLSALNACGGDVRPGEVRASQAVAVEAGNSAREGRSPRLEAWGDVTLRHSLALTS
jgi:hypothetical protein